MGPHRISAIAAVVTLTAATAIGLLTPLVLGAMVDAVTEADGDAVSRIGTLTLALVGIAVASSLLVGVSNYLLAGVGERVVADLREEVVVRVLDLPQSDVERAGRGDLVSRITGDVRLVTRAVSEALPVFATAALTIVLTLIGLGSLDWRFAVAAVIAAPIQIQALRWYLLEVGTGLPRGAGGRRCTCATAPGLAEQLRHRRIASPGRVASRTDRISIYGRRPPELVDHASTHQVLRPAQHRGVHRSVRRADHWLLAGERRADQHRCRHSRSPVLPPPLRSGGRSSQCVRPNCREGTIALARLVGVTLAPVPSAPTDPQEPVDSSASLERVTFSYRSGDAPVLRDIDITIPAGTVTALVGATGAGKSTVAKLIAGTYEPTEGVVKIGTVPRNELPPSTSRSAVALVTQEVHVFAGTLAEDLRLADPSATDNDITAALDTVGASDWLRALPGGLETVVGDGGHRLTATQAQQLALARIELLDPPLLILDEATAEAGSAGARVLDDAALALTRGRTAVTVAHRLSQAVDADQILVMDDGRVVEHGSHDELVNLGGRYAELWEAWSAPRR